jgi:hypothetical protein
MCCNAASPTPLKRYLMRDLSNGGERIFLLDPLLASLSSTFLPNVSPIVQLGTTQPNRTRDVQVLNRKNVGHCTPLPPSNFLQQLKEERTYYFRNCFERHNF